MVSMISCGIDFSINCPAVCIHNTDTKQSNFFFVKEETKKVSKINFPDNIKYKFHDNSFETKIDKYDFVTDSIIDYLKGYSIDKFFIEGYSIASKGLIFDIAEATGILKYKIRMKFNKSIIPIAPTSIKKFATGKGNANKKLMVEEYQKTIKESWMDILTTEKAYQSPLNDLIDAFYTSTFGCEK